MSSACSWNHEQKPVNAHQKERGLLKVPTDYYQQFDANYHLDVPAEGYGGWKKEELELSLDHTAVVIMHAWDGGTREQYPGWHRACEYLPRSYQIARTVFPKLLTAVRSSGLTLFHVVGDYRDYYKEYPGYKRAVRLAKPAPGRPEQVKVDPTLERLRRFREDHVWVGKHNTADVTQGLKAMNFLPEAKPLGEEGIAENGSQLFALCQEAGINHLIYGGFAINDCLQFSPGGMADMSRRGLMCSAFRQAVTAVENRETARKEIAKELALWYVAVNHGFVYDVEDFVKALDSRSAITKGRSQ